jgi:hypothetical protein
MIYVNPQMKPTNSEALFALRTATHRQFLVIETRQVLHRKHRLTVHRPGDDACQECDRYACARYRGDDELLLSILGAFTQ